MLIEVAGNLLAGLVTLGIVLRFQDRRLRRLPEWARDTRRTGTATFTAKGPTRP